MYPNHGNFLHPYKSTDLIHSSNMTHFQRKVITDLSRPVLSFTEFKGCCVDNTFPPCRQLHKPWATNTNARFYNGTLSVGKTWAKVISQCTAQNLWKARCQLNIGQWYENAEAEREWLQELLYVIIPFPCDITLSEHGLHVAIKHFHKGFD